MKSGQTVTWTSNDVCSATDCPGTNPGDFNLPAAQNQCSGFTFTTNGCLCTFVVNFSPQATGVRTAVVNHTTNLGATAATLGLNGAGFTLTPQSPAPAPGVTPSNQFMLSLPEPQPTASPFFSGSASITFDSGNATINWSGTLQYQNMEGVPNPGATVSISKFRSLGSPFTLAFGTPAPGATPTPSTGGLYPTAGGQLAVKATYSVPKAVNTPVTTSFNAIVSGLPAPPGIDDAVTNQLVGLYAQVKINNIPKGSSFSPVTTGLMTQIAEQESSYQQFTDTTLFNVDAMWLLQGSGGGHIGLMMVPTTMTDAWDWVQNTYDGVIPVSRNSSSFQNKLAAANRLAKAIIKTHPGLMLNACQFEEMATELYGPWPGIGPVQQYYIPACVDNTTHKIDPTGNECTAKKPTGTWQWQINDNGATFACTDYSDSSVAGNFCGACYVASVRSKITPAVSMPTSCPVNSPVITTADPPPLDVNPLDANSCIRECNGCPPP